MQETAISKLLYIFYCTTSQYVRHSPSLERVDSPVNLDMAADFFWVTLNVTTNSKPPAYRAGARDKGRSTPPFITLETTIEAALYARHVIRREDIREQTLHTCEDA
jgi:hypothetical protein